MLVTRGIKPPIRRRLSRRALVNSPLGGDGVRSGSRITKTSTVRDVSCCRILLDSHFNRVTAATMVWLAKIRHSPDQKVHAKSSSEEWSERPDPIRDWGLRAPRPGGMDSEPAAGCVCCVFREHVKAPTLQSGCGPRCIRFEGKHSTRFWPEIRPELFQAGRAGFEPAKPCTPGRQSSVYNHPTN